MTDDLLEEASVPLPEGYQPMIWFRGFGRQIGPLYERIGDDGTYARAFLVQEHHTNGMGNCHGGMLMAFADGLLGTAVFRETKTVALTIRMNSDFLSSARPGDWLEGTARVTKATRSVVFCEAELFVGQRPILKATGVFKLMARHKEAAAGEPSVS